MLGFDAQHRRKNRVEKIWGWMGRFLCHALVVSQQYIIFKDSPDLKNNHSKTLSHFLALEYF